MITAEEMRTHLYNESIEVISRNDSTILLEAIDTAEQEAYSYLGKYDREAIFSAKGKKRNTLLMTFIKDMATWHFVNLCNAGYSLEQKKDRYDRAVQWLRQVQKGEISPNLPIIDNNNDGIPDGKAEVLVSSNPKRRQHF